MSTILIVEDSAVIREPIEAVLTREGYGTLCARDGAEAIAILSRPGGSIPDLILLDLVLPRIDGVGVLAHIQSTVTLRGIPVLVLSAQTDREHIRRIARLGIAGYLLKTHFSLRHLLEKIRELLKPSEALADKDPGATGVAEPVGAAPATSVNPADPAAGRQVAGGGGASSAPAQAAPVSIETAPDPVEAVRALEPICARSEVLERIGRAGELRALSPTVTQVLKLTGNARCSIDSVAKAIAQDHAIALKIMKLANSTVYTRGEPVDSVQKAVVRIGIERIRQAVLNISVVERFSSAAFDDHLSTEHFWEHSIACGLIASELAHASSPAHAETAFTLGLLHDVGRVIYAEQLGPMYLEVLEMARRVQVPLEQVESRMLLVNHADVMERILRLWNFSQDLIAPIVCHHLSAANVRSTASRQATEALCLGLANRLAHAMLLGSSGNETIYPIQEFCSALDIDGPVIERIESQAREQTDDVKFAMLAHSSGSGSAGGWIHRQDELRNGLGFPINPIFAGDSPEIDAVRIFCDHIRSPEQAEPNLAVAHIAQARECAAVSNRLRLEEQSRGVSNLPLIVLSPGAKLMVDEGLLAGRSWMAMPIPFAIARFLNAVRGMVSAPEIRAAA